MNMKKILKLWWLWLLLGAVAFAGVLYVGSMRRDTGPEYVTETAKRDVFTQTVEVGGDLESINEVSLAFETGGTVGAQFAQIGDMIAAGDVILTLKNDELSANAEKASQAVRAARATLEQTIAGSTDEAIAVAQANVTIAEVAYENAENDIGYTKQLMEETVAEAQVAVETAKDSVENVTSSSADSLEQIRQDFLTVYESNTIAVRSGLSDADEVLGIDNTSANDDYQNVLSNLDENALQQAEVWYEIAKESRDHAEDVVFALSQEASFEEIEAIFDDVQAAIQDASNTLLYTHRALDATSLTSASFTAAELEALKVQIDLARESVQATQDLLLAKQQLKETTIIASDANLDEAENALLSAEQAYQSALASEVSKNAAAEAALAVAKADVTRAQATLSEISADPRAVDLERLYAEVAAAQADLSAAQARLRKGSLVSPIAGVLTQLSFDVGEQVNAHTPVATIQTTEDQFQIVANIPESDITKITLADPVKITFDAFGSDTVFAGMVGKMDPAEKNVEGVVFYEVTVYLQEDAHNDLLKPGMSADIEILTDKRENILSLPQRAILQREGEKYVRILQAENVIEEHVVELGLRGDNGRVEILSGIKEGETVIVTVKE